jgi:hypothetical protein
MKDRRLNILRSFGVRWSDVMALITTMRETGGNPHGKPIDKAAFYFREYMALDRAEEMEMDIAKGKICPHCLSEIDPS